MTDRISSNRQPSTPTPVLSSSGRPLESPAMDQAAAEFAALLGGENRDVDRDDRLERREGSETTSESESRRPDHDRVEKKKDGGDSSQSGGEEGKDGGDEPAAEMFSLGDLILQGMSRKESAQPAPVAEAAMGASDLPLDTIVQQVADRILVSPPGPGGPEVRIMLKDGVLPGAEIRISQNAGQLQIQLVTDSTRSHEIFSQHQAALQQRLSEKLSDHEVVVNVEFGSESQPDRDGRSRNQRDIQEEIKENA